MNKKWVTIGVVSVLVLGGGYGGYKYFTPKPVVSTNIMAKAKIENVSKVITATGTVNFPHAIPLTFQQAGKIVELNVKAGDTVKAGQVLAKTEDTKLSTEVLQSQANVTSAQSKLQTLQESYNDQTRAQAQSTLAKARQSLTTAQQNADVSYLTNQVTLANQNVKQASDALAKAQQSGNASSIQSSLNGLNQAINDLTAAKNRQNGGAAEALVSAQADVTAAQYQVDQQAQGPKTGDLQSARSSIEIAQLQLASAQTDLNNSNIIAPMDAVVVSAPLLLEQQSDAKSIITITPTGDKLEVEASIDQSDITQVKVGQKVDITLDAFPNQHISGTVSLVALQGTIVSNVTTFAVTATVDQANDLLRAGMNANINIIVAEAKDVLTVPSEAIKTRGNQTGITVLGNSSTSADNVDQAEKLSTKPNNAANAGNGNAATRNAGTEMTGTGKIMENVQFIPVEIGLDDGTNVEIKSGIVEGQEVIIGTRSATTAKSPSGFSLGGGSGGNNPARAMGGSSGNR